MDESSEVSTKNPTGSALISRLGVRQVDMRRPSRLTLDGHLETVIGWHWRDTKNLELHRAFEAMPAALRHNYEFAGPEVDAMLLAVHKEHDSCASFKRQHDLIPARVTLPLAAA
jgi:hypothetical protein